MAKKEVEVRGKSYDEEDRAQYADGKGGGVAVKRESVGAVVPEE